MERVAKYSIKVKFNLTNSKKLIKLDDLFFRFGETESNNKILSLEKNGGEQRSLNL